jgi:HK97 family phage major capsid protein
MNLSELKARVAALLDEGDKIEATAAAADRELTDEETERLHQLTVEGKEAQAEVDVLEQRRAVLEARANLKEEVASKPPMKPVVEHHRESVLDDDKRGFAHLGDFAASVWKAAEGPHQLDKRLVIGAAATGLSQGVAAEGGFAVPPSFARAIWDSVREGEDSLLAMTDNYTVEGASLTFAANAETSRATGSRYGGVRGYWLNEAGQVTGSKPTLRQMKLEPEEVGALVYMTNKLMRNNLMALNQFVTRGASEEIQFLVSNAIIQGTGAGQPLGILNAPGTISIAAETGQAATTIVSENIDKMWARMLTRAKRGAVWFVSQDCEPELSNLNRSVGTGGALVYNPPGGISQLPYGQLKGRPVREVEFNPTLGTVGDIILADLGYYATGTRGGARADSSMHLRFDYAETAFRFMFEVDGQPWLASAITPFNAGNTQAPFLTLATRS